MYEILNWTFLLHVYLRYLLISIDIIRYLVSFNISILWWTYYHQLVNANFIVKVLTLNIKFDIVYIRLTIYYKKFKNISLHHHQQPPSKYRHIIAKRIFMSIWNYTPIFAQASISQVGRTITTVSHRLTCYLVDHCATFAYINKMYHLGIRSLPRNNCK